MLGFVDDTKSQVNDFNADHQPPSTELLTKMKHSAQLWNNLLWISRGALEHSKCTYHVMEWTFCKGYPQLCDGESNTNFIL